MRYEIYAWMNSERRDYERDCGRGTFMEAVYMDIFDIANYGSCIGAEKTLKEAYSFVSNYYGGFPDDFILFWDDVKKEWVKYNPFR